MKMKIMVLLKLGQIFFMLRFVQIFVHFVVIHGSKNSPASPSLVNFSKIFNEENQTLRVIDQDNVRFRLSPLPGCNAASSVVVVLSTYNNFKQRNNFRTNIKNLTDTRVIFLVGELASSHHKDQADHLQDQLAGEHMLHQDVLQISLPDTYKTTMYKTLASFVWINRYCPDTKFIMKTDDNAIVDFKKVLSILQAKYPKDIPAMIECPCPLRNWQIIRHNHTNTFFGKWRVKAEDNERVKSRDPEHQLAIFPDFCPGWLYITTPEVGLGLAIVAAHDKNIQKVLAAEETIEDVFITGVIRERLPWVKLSVLETGPAGQLVNIASHFPLLTVVKLVLLNGIVLEKGSGNVSYINSPRFLICTMLETVLEKVEKIHPLLTPAYIWDICDRDAKWPVDVDLLYKKLMKL